ncbi:MAG TPA: PP2C family protein-serine/threonine phosphatase [Candidatus Polarisedimenticolia bacterium]|nr:PP2C family protein-serine/threonine phosphatase [Candidatus Polarisedimenticolia bacterium]
MSRDPHDPTLRQILFKDVRARELPGSVRRDFKDLLAFYLDDERRAKLRTMGRVRRALWVFIFLLKSLLAKLTPARRVMIAVALFLFVFNGRVRVGRLDLSLELAPWAFLLLLVVLMLELKDKLLARDEIEVARQVQMALLPRGHPRPQGWSLWSYTRPANDVGGDLVDYLELPSGRIGVALGDVAGKGLGAALLMAKLQATLRSLAPECPSLADLGARLNAILFRDGLENRFATLFYLEITPGSARLRYLNAGHNPPLIQRGDGQEPLGASSRPLGMLPGAAYAEGSVDLAPGDLLVVYSDGLVEAENAGGEEFGAERLRRLLPHLRGQEAEAAGRRVLGEVDRFARGERVRDDLSLVTVLCGPARPGEPGAAPKAS